MKFLMSQFRKNTLNEIAGVSVVKTTDYSFGVNGLPKADVLKYYLEDNASVVIRPSGTEPKLKIYISTCLENREKSIKENISFEKVLKKLIEI